MLPRYLSQILVPVAGVVALAAALLLSHGVAHATPLDPPGIVAIDAIPTNGGGNTATSIGPIDYCVSIPLGGVATVEVVVDAVPPFNSSTINGGLEGFGFNIVYPNAGSGALNVTARSSPLAGGDGKSLLSVNVSSSIVSFTDAVPDTDADFQIVEYDNDVNTPESGAGRLYSITVTSVGAAGVALLDLTDTTGGDGDGIPNIYEPFGQPAYNPATVGDAYVAVGVPCPPPPTPLPTPTPAPTPSPTPAPPGVGGDVLLPVAGSDSSGGWWQFAALAAGVVFILVVVCGWRAVRNRAAEDG